MTMIPGNPPGSRLDQDDDYTLYTTATLPPEPQPDLTVEPGGAPLMAHLEELRSRLIKVVIAVALTSAVAVLLVITGYYLVLPRRWRRRWEQRPA